MAQELTLANFDKEVLQAEGLVLVDFWAPWCPPCRILAPLIDKLAVEYHGKVKIVKVSVETEEELAQKYQIMSIPALFFFKKGQVVGKLTGALPEEIIKEKINSLL